MCGCSARGMPTDSIVVWANRRHRGARPRALRPERSVSSRSLGAADAMCALAHRLACGQCWFSAPHAAFLRFAAHFLSWLCLSLALSLRLFLSFNLLHAARCERKTRCLSGWMKETMENGSRAGTHAHECYNRLSMWLWRTGATSAAK